MTDGADQEAGAVYGDSGVRAFVIERWTGVCDVGVQLNGEGKICSKYCMWTV